jgi:hypothetical protein
LVEFGSLFTCSVATEDGHTKPGQRRQVVRAVRQIKVRVCQASLHASSAKRRLRRRRSESATLPFLLPWQNLDVDSIGLLYVISATPFHIPAPPFCLLPSYTRHSCISHPLSATSSTNHNQTGMRYCSSIRLRFPKWRQIPDR